MVVCPKCKKNVSVMMLDLFGNGCAMCHAIDPKSMPLHLLDDPCPSCGSRDLRLTDAPALATVQTKYGPLPSKVAPGLFVLGCVDCGAAWWRFTEEGRESIRDTFGWVGRGESEPREPG